MSVHVSKFVIARESVLKLVAERGKNGEDVLLNYVESELEL